jgi:hypothetical protein
VTLGSSLLGLSLLVFKILGQTEKKLKISKILGPLPWRGEWRPFPRGAVGAVVGVSSLIP